MKRFPIFLILVLAVAYSAMARRVMWGVQAGWDARRLTLKSDLYRASNHTGWFLGPQASFQFAHDYLVLDASLLYNQRNMDFEERETKALHEHDLSYLVIPLNLRFTFRLGKPLGIYVATGPQWRRFLNRGRHIRLEDDVDVRLDPGTLSWNVGAGFDFFGHLKLGFTYNFGIDDECWKQSVSEQIRRFDIKKNSCQVSLTCLF